MADEIREAEMMEANTTVVTETRASTGSESVIDWDAAPSGDQMVGGYYSSEPAPTYYAPRGRWDFTNSQRIILALLIWLNIIMFIVGYLVITGKLVI